MRFSIIIFSFMIIVLGVLGTQLPNTRQWPTSRQHVSLPSRISRDHRRFPKSRFKSVLLVRGGGINPVKSIIATFSNLATYIGSSKSRCWIVLVLAMFNEIAATSMTKSARDTSNPTRLAIAICMYVTSLLGFASALAKIEMSIAYACWSATGTALVSVVGIFFFGEAFDIIKVLCVSLILLGVIGLNLRDNVSH